VAPPAPAPLTGAAAALAGAMVLGGGGGGGSAGAAVDPSTKPFRELFVGNVIEGTPATDIQEFLGAVMCEVGLADSKLEGNPIMHVRTNGKFAFIELRSIDETNNALNMGQWCFQRAPHPICSPFAAQL